jgi:hypothetical protein
MLIAVGYSPSELSSLQNLPSSFLFTFHLYNYNPPCRIRSSMANRPPLFSTAKELSFSKARAEDYKALEHIDNESSKRVKGEMGRYARRVGFFSSKENCATLEHVVTAYLNNNRDVDYYPALVPICAPFVITLKEECDAYYCFERLMKLLGEVSRTFFFSFVFA